MFSHEQICQCLKVLMVVGIGVLSSEMRAAFADGSYECDRVPKESGLKWQKGRPWGKDKKPSMAEWVICKNGIMKQKENAPKHIGMFLSPSPINSDSYTVEIKFRINKIEQKRTYRHPLVFHVSRNGANYQWVYAGFLNESSGAYVSSNVSLTRDNKNEWSEAFFDNSVTNGEWITLRLTTESHNKGQICTMLVNGKDVQRIETPVRSNRGSNIIYLASDDIADDWEIDYIRWKNKAISLDETLDPPLSSKRKTKNKLDKLIDSK